jgi:putative ABC transport system permease protein
MSSLRADVKQAIRSIREAPGFFAAVILTLAIGIGANTALFSVVRTVLLDPLPYPNSDQLVVVSKSPWNRADAIEVFREMPSVVQEFAAYSPERLAITGGDQPYETQGSRITPNFFHMFGVDIARGRDFTAADALPGAAPTAIIGYGVWMTQYGGRADVIGRMVRVNDEPREIIGVTREGFQLYGPRSEDPRIWLPFRLQSRDTDGRFLWVIPALRMKAGVSVQQLQAQFDQRMPEFLKAHPDLGRADQFPWKLVTIKSEIVKDIRTALIILQLTAATLLLIACVNVANLLLARASSRQRELAIRSALGASRARLVRQLVTESIVLSLFGGVAGVLLMQLTLGLLLRIAPSGVPRLADVHVDVSAFLAATAIAVVTGLVFGLIPAAIALRGSLHDYLKEGGRGPSRSNRQQRISQVLVVTEVTLTLVLLVGAGLLVRTFFRLSDQPVGFRTENVIAMPIQIPPTGFNAVEQLDEFYTAALARIAAVPGVHSVALANNLPINRGGAGREFLLVGEEESPLTRKVAEYGVVSPGYFAALDIPLVKGRYFDAGDRRGGLKVAIVDQTMARLAFRGEDPIGKRFRFEDGNDAWLTVVGVVGNTRGGGLARDVAAGFYIPYTQRPGTRSEIAVGHLAKFLIRSTAPVGTLAAPLRQAIWTVNPQQPIAELIPLAAAVARGAAPHRFRATLLATFSGIALVLVLVGIYGVIEYAVGERTREFGVRMALGAAPGVILRNVLMWGLRLAGIGVVFGLAGVFLLNRFLADMLFGVTPTDPPTLAIALVVILLVTIAACVIPARRATRVDPAMALRADRPTRRSS